MSAWRESGRGMREHPQHDAPRPSTWVALPAMQNAYRHVSATNRAWGYAVLAVSMATQGGA
jgi:hypothetical protein